MKECSKSINRRLSNPNFISRYFVGKGIDIGGKPDPLSLYQELFCRIDSIKIWDWDDGDAQHLNGEKDNSYDFVHSSHCLEHLVDPIEGISNWFRVLRPNGHLVITVPDEDLYEQGIFPSTFNKDHKWTFTIFKQKSWSKKSINIVDLIQSLGEQAQIIKIEELSATYRYSLPRYDQTLTPIGECGIEVIIRKRLDEEIEIAGRLNHSVSQPSKEIRIHLNQYRNDLQSLKSSNITNLPFTDDSLL